MRQLLSTMSIMSCSDYNFQWGWIGSGIQTIWPPLPFARHSSFERQYHGTRTNKQRKRLVPAFRTRRPGTRTIVANEELAIILYY